VVKDEDVLSRCAWTPLVGTTLNNKVVATFVNGVKVYHNGVIDETHKGKALKYKVEK
jgi:dihydroorotase